MVMNVQLVVDGLGIDLDHDELLALCWHLAEREDAAEILGRLARHASEAVQEAVASSDCLPREAHLVLATSPSDKVVAAALQSDRASALGADVLSRLAARPTDVALSVVGLLQRLSVEVRERILPQLQVHPDPAVRKALIAELSNPEALERDGGDGEELQFPS